MTRISILAFVVAALLLTSCSQKPVAEVELVNSDNFWSQEDVLEMNFDISDTTEVYNLSVTIEHSTEYAWENLYIKVHNLFPDGDTLSREISLDLADKKGQWQGQCDGSTCKATVDLQTSFFFPQTGNYKIWMEQYMREVNLEHIQRVHLGLYPHEAN